MTWVHGGPVIPFTAGVLPIAGSTVVDRPQLVVAPVLLAFCVPGAARSLMPHPNPALPLATVHCTNGLGEPLMVGGFEKLATALLLAMPYARITVLQEKVSSSAFPGFPLVFGAAAPLQKVNAAEAVEAEPRVMTPRTPASETRQAIRRQPRQPRSDRIELIT